MGSGLFGISDDSKFVQCNADTLNDIIFVNLDANRQGSVCLRARIFEVAWL